MKKLILFITSILGVSPAFSSHLMGGQITAKPLSGTTYVITMTLYRDTLGIPISNPDYIHYDELNGGYPDFQRYVHAIGVPYINNTEEYVYTDTVVFPGAGTYNIWFTNCCRNLAIANGPASAAFYVNTIVEVDSVNPNSTPVFLNKPITIAGINSVWTYNPLPYDADGDSLAWHLTTPLQGVGSPCLYVLPSGDPFQPFTLDTLTGQITWMPDLLGYYVASFLVDEFRAGIKIGEIRRDMQIIVVPSSGARPAFASTIWPVNAQGNYQFELDNAGNAFNLSIIATDYDSNFISLIVAGEPFLLSTNPAQATTVINSNGLAQVDISWTPSPSQARNTPYLLAARCNENYSPYVFSQDITILLHVNAVTSVPDHDGASIGVMYPNLVNTQIMLPLTLAKPAKLELSIINSLGQKTNYNFIYNLNPGSQVVSLNNLNLPGGIYFLRISDGERVTVQKFVCVND